MVDNPDKAPPTDPPAAVVGLGASAGGLAALQAFMAEVPAGAGLAYVVVQHMAPDAESLLPALLAKRTRLPVAIAEDRMPLAADHVYVVPPGKCLRLAGGRLRVEPRRDDGTLPIDAFFRSLAEALDERAVAIVLSGTANDGTLGLRAIKERGGLTIAQAPETAEHQGMPRSAIRSGMTDAVAAPAAMPAIVVRYVADLASGRPLDEPIQAVLTFIRARTKHDFRLYKKGTVVRRIQRRMALRGASTPAAYLELLRTDAAELDHLHQDLMIGVTRFFRDPGAFDALAELALRPMVAAREPEDGIRVWTPGCSTGEEAYSLAMLLMEAFAAAGRDGRFRIFATDIDVRALETGRAGLYPEGIRGDVPPERMARHFAPAPGGFQVDEALRERIVFAEQNLVGDPPFHRLDLIVCRNLLIYLEPELQRKVLALFHFALKPDGVLMLGPSESTGGREDLFAPVSKKHRIFRRLNAPSPADYPLAKLDPRPREATRAEPRPVVGSELPALVHAELLAEFTPAAVLVNERLDVLYFHGDVGRFLAFPAGRTTYDLLAMCPARARAKIRRAITRSQAHRDRERTVTPWDAAIGAVAVTAKPVAVGEDRPCYLLAFEEVVGAPPVEAFVDTGATVAQLEGELRSAREELRSTTQEMETANEELRASNEEMMSMNEELQATNEELETTKEELQSLNEELTTVNQELQDKILELEEANNDLINFLTATETATVFLDPSLRIRRFTPSTRTLLNVLPTDVGRPLAELARNVDDEALLTDAAAVLERLTPLEREVCAPPGAWYLRRVIPYRTRDRRIDGVVVTYTDITHSKAGEADRADRELRRHLAEVEAKASELAQANQRLVELDGLKADFLNAASHELRTPLTSIVGFAEFLEDELVGPLTADQRAHVGAIQAGAQRLRRLVEDLLDFARLEAGTFRLHRRRFDLSAVVARAIESLRPQFVAAGLTVSETHTDPAPHVLGDPDRIEQVVLNLVGNAVKFTEAGGHVDIRVEAVGGEARVEVADNGIGIAPGTLDMVFEKFFQADAGLTREHAGTGLGLAIARSLVAAHGGQVGAESKPGEGATFWFSLPLDPPADLGR